MVMGSICLVAFVSLVDLMGMQIIDLKIDFRIIATFKGIFNSL